MREANETRVDGTTERRRYYFNNDHGASVIRTPYSYGGRDGLWELAVLEKAAEGAWDAWDAWDLCYTTPIADEVIGWLSDDEVEALLDRIEKLPKREVEEWTDS
jgi:hypothetical protein